MLVLHSLSGGHDVMLVSQVTSSLKWVELLCESEYCLRAITKMCV